MNALVLTAMAAAVVASDNAGWATFSRTAYSPSPIEVTIGILSGPTLAGKTKPVFWFRATEKGRPTRWTDTQQCPAALPSISEMRAIQMPPDPPVDGIYISAVTLDSAHYMLDAPASEGELSTRVRIISVDNTPLAGWVDTTLTRLAPCWKSEPPMYPN